MGTQFSSRIKGSSGERLRSKLVGLAKDRPRRISLGTAVLNGTLAEAAAHHFFDEFESSPLFAQILRWLKGLHSDAEFHGFETTIQKYELNHSGNAIVTLTRALRELLEESEVRKSDPFRVAVRDAAVSVLGAVTTKPTDRGPGITDAQRFGFQFRKMDTRELVEIFVKSFISNLVSAMLHSADPNLTSISGEVRDGAEGAAARLGKRVVARVQETAGLANDDKIREILVEELRAHAKAGADGSS